MISSVSEPERCKNFESICRSFKEKRRRKREGERAKIMYAKIIIELYNVDVSL